MELIIFAACGAIAGLASIAHDRKRMAELEDSMREIRAVLAADFPYRLPTRADAELVAQLGAIHMALAQDGLRPLGDLVMELPGRKPISIMRALVDAAGTTVVYLSAYPQTPGTTYLLLESYTRNAEYITHVDNPVRASAPFSYQQSVQAAPVRETLARHRAFCSAAAVGTLAVIESLDDLVRALRANHAMFVRWRESLSPEELLEIDLRTVLGAQYAVHGPRWKRRLALRLPAATLRKKP